MHDRNPLPSVAAASLAAGPLAVVSHQLASAYLQLPEVVVIDAQLFWVAPIGVFAAAMIGFLPALILNLIGAWTMMRLARVGGIARTRLGWVAAGAALGGLLAWLIGADAPVGVALVFTSAACGWIDWNGALPD